MTTREPTAPRPFQVGGQLFVRLSIGLCRMGSWGWEPVTEGFLTTHRAIADRNQTNTRKKTQP